MDTRGYLNNAQAELLVAHQTYPQAEYASEVSDAPKKKGLFGRLTEKFKDTVAQTRTKVMDVLTKERYLPGQQAMEAQITDVAKRTAENVQERVETAGQAVLDRVQPLVDVTREVATNVGTVVKNATIAGTTLATLAACGGTVPPTGAYMPLDQPSPEASVAPAKEEVKENVQWEPPKLRWIEHVQKEGGLDFNEYSFPNQDFRVITRSSKRINGHQLQLNYLEVYGIDKEGKAEKGKFIEYRLDPSGTDYRLSTREHNGRRAIVSHASMVNPKEVLLTFYDSPRIGLVDLTKVKTEEGSRWVYIPENEKQELQDNWKSSEPQRLEIDGKLYMAVVQFNAQQDARMLLTDGEETKILQMEKGFNRITGAFQLTSTQNGDHYVAMRYTDPSTGGENRGTQKIVFAKVSSLLQSDRVTPSFELPFNHNETLGAVNGSPSSSILSITSAGSDPKNSKDGFHRVRLYDIANGEPKELGQVTLPAVDKDGTRLSMLMANEVLDGFVAVSLGKDLKEKLSVTIPIPTAEQAVYAVQAEGVSGELPTGKGIGQVKRLTTDRIYGNGAIATYAEPKNTATSFSTKSFTGEAVTTPLSWASPATAQQSYIPVQPGAVVLTKGQPLHFDQFVQ